MVNMPEGECNACFNIFHTDQKKRLKLVVNLIARKIPAVQLSERFSSILFHIFLFHAEIPLSETGEKQDTNSSCKAWRLHGHAITVTFLQALQLHIQTIAAFIHHPARPAFSLDV
jgi:hypothetical protein